MTNNLLFWGFFPKMLAVIIVSAPAIAFAYWQYDIPIRWAFFAVAFLTCLWAIIEDQLCKRAARHQAIVEILDAIDALRKRIGQQ